VSLAARDLRTARTFYAAVLGWQFRPGSQGWDNYVLALSNGAPVAGMGATAAAWGVPVNWTAYFAADSADRVAERVRERSATVAVGPIRFGNGRLVCAADQDEALFSVWEGEVDPDWRVGSRTGAPAWLELRTRDPFAAALFYGEVFEWDAPDSGVDVQFEYDEVVLRVAGHTVAALRGGGLGTAPDPHIRPQWHVHFCVADVEDATARAAAAGGTVVSPPSPTPFGPVAALRDPEGGLFHVAYCHRT
jgi:predicted enzyme related to lactoylglutathione lyase